MAYGFIGNKSASYFQGVANTLSMANSVLSSTGGSAYFAGTSADEQSLQYPVGVGTPANIAVDEELYSDTLRKIDKVDDDMAESVYNVVARLEKMCEVDFVVPDTTPKVLATLNEIKQTLGEFRDVTTEAVNVVQSFITEIGLADR